MPTYTYAHDPAPEPRQPPCQMREVEVEQRIVDSPLATCPTCGGALRRLIPSGISAKFKGGAPTPRFHR